MILSKLIKKYRAIYRYFLRRPYFKALRIMVSSDVTIISNNCTGSRISQDLHYQYNSPTVGLYIKYPEYIIFLENLREFMECELVFKKNEISPYPIGHLRWNGFEIAIYFLHYRTAEEAKRKWERRKKRINWNKLLIIGTDTDYCSTDDVIRFMQLPYQCKIFFSNKKRDMNDKTYIFVNELVKKKVLNGYDYAHILYRYMIKQPIKFD